MATLGQLFERTINNRGIGVARRATLPMVVEFWRREASCVSCGAGTSANEHDGGCLQRAFKQSMFLRHTLTCAKHS